MKENGLVDSVKLLIEDIDHIELAEYPVYTDHENELLSSGKKITLFRIVQEQMKNILNTARLSK